MLRRILRSSLFWRESHSLSMFKKFVLIRFGPPTIVSLVRILAVEEPGDLFYHGREVSALVLSAKAKIILLSAFNLILIGVSWFMACYAYPKLPDKMPLWINFIGQKPMSIEKSPFFFVYAVSQILLVVIFLALIHFKHRREKDNLPSSVHDLQKEFILLILIFFQLIFIHIQRSLILMAHGVEEGIRPLYFYSVFGMIFVLIPYYRMRLKALRKRKMTTDGL